MEFLKTYELYKSTYNSAAKKLRYKQPNLSKRMAKHSIDYGLHPFKYNFMKDYKFDVYVHFTVMDDEIYPKEIEKGVQINDYFFDGEVFIFTCTYNKYFLQLDISPFMQTPIYFFDADNKLTNRRDAKKLMELLYRVYTIEDPNLTAKAISDINDVDYSSVEVDPDNIETFWDFIQARFGGWDQFLKTIDMRTLWDYPPEENEEN